eukprot:XP_011675865.1 PREDICTED: LOW QUALITY PROTEIN: lupus La protein homolog B-like [Strongylocentrotus purpuratus]
MAETEVKTEGGGAPSALEKKVARQVEYYFGDANLKRDTFLQLQIREDNGCILLYNWWSTSILLSFKRRKFSVNQERMSEFDDYEKGCILHFTGVNDQTSREDLKELFGDHGTIQWVDFERGQTEGTIRFSEDTKHRETLARLKQQPEGPFKSEAVSSHCVSLKGKRGAPLDEGVEVMQGTRLKKQQGRRGRKTKWFEKRDNRRGDRGGDRDRGDRDREDRYQGKKTKFEDDDEGGNGASEDVKPEQGVKRPG